MVRGLRHRSVEPPRADDADVDAAFAYGVAAYCYYKGVSAEVAHRVVHRVLRVAKDAIREERPELRAVADQRPSPPVG